MTTPSCYTCSHLEVCYGEKEFSEHAWVAARDILDGTAHELISMELPQLKIIIVKAISAFCSAYLAEIQEEPTDA